MSEGKQCSTCKFVTYTAKRRKAPSPGPSTSKRGKFDEDKNYFNELSDDILLLILSKLDNFDLIVLMETCKRFESLCTDYTLWKTVYMPFASAGAGDLKTVASVVHSETTKIKILGALHYFEVLTPYFQETVQEKCPNLKEYSVPFHSFDCNVIGIHIFPRTITFLDMSHTMLRNIPADRSYFRDISVIMPKLKVLKLSHCSWFEPHSLMALSKLFYLEELYLNDCIRVRDCLAYCGLSTRGGFKSLRTLDLRRCAISNSELGCFSSVRELKNIYLESCRDCLIFIDPAIISLCTTRRAAYPTVRLEKLVLRHYSLLQDNTLIKLANVSESLKYLDLTGCKVKKETLERFKRLRPGTTIDMNADLTRLELPEPDSAKARGDPCGHDELSRTPRRRPINDEYPLLYAMDDGGPNAQPVGQ